MTGRRATRLVLAACVAAGGPACEEDRPYTPFTVASSPPSHVPPAARSSATAAPSGRGFSPKPAVIAPPRRAAFSIEGRSIEAPHGRWIERAVTADLDGDGARDAVAWTVPESGSAVTSIAGELWLYPGGGAARRLAPMPGFVPTGTGCAPSWELTQTGPHTVTAVAAAKCKAKLIDRAPTKGLAVLAPASARPLLVGLRIADAVAGEELSFSVESVDRDADGRDDVVITVSLRSRGPAASRAEARLEWFDRAAGPSRDLGQPRRSLEQIASDAERLSRHGKTAGDVARRVRTVRRLVASLCAEAGVPRILDFEGEAIPCGDLGKTAAALVRAEVQAALARHDVREALAALGRDGWYGPALPAAARRALQRKVDRELELRDVTEAMTPSVVPAPGDGRPRWSPLRFESDGSLLVLSKRSVYRVLADAADAERLEADGGIEAWSTIVKTPAGRRWVGVSFPCGASEVVLVMDPPDAHPRSSSVLAPRPGSCAGGHAPAVPSPAPLQVTAAGVEALVAGSLVGGHAGPVAPHPGAPWSPDGSLLVSVAARGLLVTGKKKPELWRGAAIDAPLSLHDCVVANGARSIACIRDGRVVIFRAAPRSARD